MEDSSKAPHSKKSAGRFRLVAACAAIAFFINILVSNDWCFGAFTAAFLAAVLVGVIDLLASPLVRRLARPAVGRATVGFMVAVVVGLSIQLTDNKAFRLVFEIDLPAGVSEVVAERRYSGGPGDEVFLLEFHTDLATLERCLSGRGFAEDTEVVNDWHQLFKGHRGFWEHVFGGLLPKDHGWRDRLPPMDAAVYRGGDGITPQITLLWDPDAGMAYVLYTMG